MLATIVFMLGFVSAEAVAKTKELAIMGLNNLTELELKTELNKERGLEELRLFRFCPPPLA